MCILKQLFFSMSVNNGFRNIYLQARSRGRGRGGGTGGHPEIFRPELNSATKVEFFY